MYKLNWAEIPGAMARVRYVVLERPAFRDVWRQHHPGRSGLRE